MNNETLKIDLCARNAFGVWLNDEANSYSFKMKGIGESTIEEDNGRIIVYDANSDEFYLTEVKPILFPSLTEPITINGETFVPLDRIKKFAWDNKIVLDHKFVEYGQIDLNRIPNFVIELCYLWHINYRLQPDQFIAVKESTNPYK